MRGAEEGFLLLTGTLGDPQRRPLSMAQLRVLHQRMHGSERPSQDRDLVLDDLKKLGYDGAFAQRILDLFGQKEMLAKYLRRAEELGCAPLTRISTGFPQRLLRQLGEDCPGSLWFKGDLSLLQKPCISVVGSRDILPPNRAFAWEVGVQAAKQGYVLVSGNARGADRIAQSAAHRFGGGVICVVADALSNQPLTPNTLYISEEGFDCAFSAVRALSRNRLIHAMGAVTLVCQCGDATGGTWDGTVKNLRFGLSPVCCFRDGSHAMDRLEQMGAFLVGLDALSDLSSLSKQTNTLFDQ